MQSGAFGGAPCSSFTTQKAGENNAMAMSRCRRLPHHLAAAAAAASAACRLRAPAALRSAHAWASALWRPSSLMTRVS